MAQCKVTDFYAVQKKNADAHPSKRRKTARLNEPPILTAKKNKEKGVDFEAPVLVVTSGPSQTSFQPSKEVDLNFNKAIKDNNDKDKSASAEEVRVFSAEHQPEQETRRTTRSRRAVKAEPVEKAPAQKGRPKKARGKKAEKAESQQKDIREALQTPSTSDAPPTSEPQEVVGEEATAHHDDHELVITPPSSPSALEQIQKSRKRPKKVAYIIRVNEDGEPEDGQEKNEVEEDGGTPRKMKKVEDSQTTPKRTPQQLMTPSPKMRGCLPGSVKKLNLSSARKKLNLDGEASREKPVIDSDHPINSLKQSEYAAKPSPILGKAKNLMKRLSESMSPSKSPSGSPKEGPSRDESKNEEGSSTPVKGKGRGKGPSNRVEELKQKIKDAKEKAKESEESTSKEGGLDNLISRLSKNSKKSDQAPSIEHNAATQSKSNKLLELQAKLAAIQKEKSSLKKDIRAEQAKRDEPVVKAAEVAPKEAKAASSKAKPAYEKHAHLAQKVDAPSGELPLPYKYKMLLEFFRNMDQAVSIYYNRKELITFSKLRSAVQELTRRSFEEKHLAQIVTVDANAYDLRRESAKDLFKMKNLTNYELTVEPRLHDSAVKSDARPPMTALALLNRRNKFHHSLIGLVRKQHTKFLESLTPPVKVDEDKVQRWHPKFKLDELPDITPATLPQPPEVEKFTSAKEVLDKAKGSMNQRIEAALKLMEEKKKENASTSSSTASPKSKDSPAPKASTKGIPAALLAKIREKEAKKAVENLVMSGSNSERVNMLGRLPNFIKILRTFFLTEKKAALLIEEVVKKVGESHRSAIGSSAAEAHIRLIAEVAPEWLTITKVSTGTYVKINKTMDINKIVEKIEKQKKISNS